MFALSLEFRQTLCCDLNAYRSRVSVGKFAMWRNHSITLLKLKCEFVIFAVDSTSGEENILIRGQVSFRDLHHLYVGFACLFLQPTTVFSFKYLWLQISIVSPNCSTNILFLLIFITNYHVLKLLNVLYMDLQM